MHSINKSQLAISTVFILLLSAVYGTIISIHQSTSALIYYGIFSLLLINLYINKKTSYKRAQLTLSILLIFAGGFIFPSEIEEIEEVYTFIPLLYLTIVPGTMLPIVVGLLLLTAYFPSFKDTPLTDFIEDSSELMSITVFATVMTYFQQKHLRQMKELERESNTDYLTRLPNRKRFIHDTKKLAVKCATSKGEIEKFCMVLVDLDGFKKINDQLGHRDGDKILCMVSDRLLKLETPTAKLYRLSGDEFAFLCEGEESLSRRIKNLTHEILHLSKKPYVMEANHYITSSIGVSTYPDDSADVNTLLSNADLAMFKAKNNGKNQTALYDTTIMSNTLRKFQIENALRRAIENDELFMLYQPKVDTKTGKFHSAEALIRWIHPSLGFMSPVEFIPIAEESGLIVPIGEWVLETVCRQIVKWRNFPSVSTIAVNVSSVQLSEPNFIATVEKILRKTGCRGEWLEIEQTETWVMENPDTNIDILNKLKSLNVTLSLDDFGTAYSSLSQIRRLPLDVIKIDKSFIDNCVHNTQDHMLVRTIIQLGHNLGMDIVAEGVEYEEQRQLLEDEECDFYQGYLYSKPVNVEEIEVILRNQPSTSEEATS